MNKNRSAGIANDQQLDFENEYVQSRHHPAGYPNDQQYWDQQSNYHKRPVDTEQYDDYGYEPTQQSHHYSDPRDEGFGANGANQRSNRNERPSQDRIRGQRSPPVAYEVGGCYEEAKSQQGQFDPQNNGYPARAEPQQPQQPSKQYPQDQARDPRLYHRNRPPHGEAPNYWRDDQHVGNGYGERQAYNGPRRDNLQQQAYGSNEDWQPRAHRRGRSYDHQEQGYNIRREVAPHDVRRDFAAQRPSHDRPRSRSPRRQNPDKRKVFADPTPPDSVSWDNPFPTFPAAKKKGMQDDRNVDGSMAEMRIDDSALSRPASRPQTVDNRGENGNEKPRNGYARPQTTPQQSNRDGYGRATAPPRFQEANASDFKRPYVNNDRPRPSTGRRSEETSQGIAKSNAAFQPGAGRSRTMPDNVSSVVLRSELQKEYGGASGRQEPGPTAGYYGSDNTSYISDRPPTASESRPTGPVRSHSNEVSRLRDNQARPQHSTGALNVQYAPNRPPASRDSIAEVYDSYYDGSPSPASPHQPPQGYKAYQPPIGEAMPNFGAAPITSPAHYRGMTIDDHLSSQPSSPAVPPVPSHYQRQHAAPFDRGQVHDQVPRSRSQPDLKNRRPPRIQPNDGFDFGIPPEPSATPYIEHGPHPPRQYPSERSLDRSDYNHQQGDFRANPQQPWAPHRPNKGSRPPEPYSQQASKQFAHDQFDPLAQRRPSPNGHPREPGAKPSPDIRTGPASPPPRFPLQPDALPAHPAPVRAGLISSSPPTQPPKPAPVRNYNSNSSPLQNFSPAPPLASSRPVEEKRASAPVSQDELDRLRQTMKANPSDQKLQMTLATKLVEAAAALDDGVPRLDQKTLQKTRERYFAEAHKIVKRLVSTGYPDGMFFLGDSYSQGRLGLERDAKEAFTLYQSAAKAGHAQAAFRVAVCCELGLEEDGGTKRDLGKAVQWYKRAAQLGDTPAMYKIGIIQLKGLLGQPKDTGEAVVWLRRAAEKADKENPHALHELVSDSNKKTRKVQVSKSDTIKIGSMARSGKRCRG